MFTHFNDYLTYVLFTFFKKPYCYDIYTNLLQAWHTFRIRMLELISTIQKYVKELNISSVLINIFVLKAHNLGGSSLTVNLLRAGWLRYLPVMSLTMYVRGSLTLRRGVHFWTLPNVPNRFRTLFVTPMGLEPMTPALKVLCSTYWATKSFQFIQRTFAKIWIIFLISKSF